MDYADARTHESKNGPARRHLVTRRSFLTSLLLTTPVGALLSACTTTKEVTVSLDGDGQSAFGFRIVEFGRDDVDANVDLRDLASGPDSTGPRTLDELTESLPSLPIGDLSASPTAGPTPVGFRAPTIRIETDTIVVPVGVTDDGFFDVPAREDIGWYRFGPEPGAPGSAVLAAHITLDGVDGAFRYLADFEAGDIITVIFDDGSESDFEVQALAQYDKEVLPLERLFDRSGPARLILITCGGAFNPQVRSFEDNLIVYGVPI